MSTTHALIGWVSHHWGSVPSSGYEDYKLFYLTVDSSPVGNCESLACDTNGFQNITFIIIHCRSDCFLTVDVVRCQNLNSLERLYNSRSWSQVEWSDALWLISECIVKAIDFRTAFLLACFRLARCISNDVSFWQPLNAFFLHLTQKINYVLFERSLIMMNDDENLFFILIFVLELFGFFVISK